MEFPVDDATLLAIEHALGGVLTFDRPDDAAEDDDGPWLVGADYSLHTLLDFLAGCSGRDPNEELMGHTADGTPIYYDTRIHFSEHDLIKALIREIRALREAARCS